MHATRILLTTLALTTLFAPPVGAYSVQGSASVRMVTASELGGLSKQSDLSFTSAPNIRLASAQPAAEAFLPSDLLNSEPARFTLPGAADQHFTVSLPGDDVVHLECVAGNCAGERISARTFNHGWGEGQSEGNDRAQKYMEVGGELDLPAGAIQGTFQGTFEMTVHYE